MTGFKYLVVGSLVCLAVAASAVESDWFSVSLADYSQGQPLTSVGAAGGAWQVPISAVATNVYDGIRNGIAVQTDRVGDVLFEPSAPSAGGDVERIDFGMCPEEIFEDTLPDFDGVAGLTAALIDGTPVFVGFTSDGWMALSGAGVAPAVGVWFDGRIELRTVDGFRLVSYLVKHGDGYVRLADAAGATWFRTAAPRAEGGLESLSFVGNGRFSDFAGREDDGQAMRLFRWIGGATGDWNDAANWTTNGVAAGTVPGEAGAIAAVDGAVSLTNGTESGTVNNLTVGFGEDGTARRMGGGLETAVSLDASRPRAGRPIAAGTSTFLGIQPTYFFAWRRGSTAKAYEAEYVSEAASYTPTAADYDHWFKFTAYGEDGAAVLEKEFFFSKLPVLYLTTNDGATPSERKETHDGRMLAQGNDEWKSLYDGKMTIKVRGNTTASYPKKPWKLKLDKKAEMFGIPKSKHWVLLANYNDQSMLRNKLAYDFANDIGSLGMKSTWAECVLNGAWQGTYQFCEHIRIAKERVNVHDWEGDAGDIAEAFAEEHALTSAQEDALATQLEQNLSWVTSDSFTFVTNGVTLAGQPSALLKKFTDDITGGYLFEFSNEYDETSKFTTTSGSLALKTMLKNPEYLRANPEMFGYCQSFLQNYWDACTSQDGYSTEGKYIGEYCDFDSMVNYWLAMEFFGNNDAVYKSRYGYKGQGEKFAFGPVWDFDWGVGSVRVSTAATVSCFVNGIRVVDRQLLDNGVFSAAIPPSAFTAAQGEPNCVAFIAYDSSGDVVARNYALVTQGPSDTMIIILR